MPEEQNVNPQEELGEAFASFIDKGFEPETEKAEEGEAPRPADDDEAMDLDEGNLSDDDESAEDDQSDEDTADDEETDQDEAEDDEEQSSDASDDAFVEIDGEKVPVSELKQGYLRQSDYTAKTVEVANQRKQVEAQTAQVVETQQQLGKINATMLGFLSRILPPEPTLELYHQDPVSYNDQKIQREHVLRQMQGVQQLLDQQVSEEQKKADAEYQETVQKNGQELAKARPFLRDPEKRTAYFKDLTENAQKFYGLDPEFVMQTTDHKAFLVLEDAIRFRKAKAKAPKVKEKVRGKPVLRAGNRNVKQSSRTLTRARETIDRAAKTGSIKDTAELFGALLTAED